MTPLLVLAFGFMPATAVGTDLLYAAITKSGGSWVHHRHHNIDWAITGRLALGSVPAAALTLLLLAQLGVQGHGATGLISVVLGVALLLTAASLIYRQRLLDLSRRRPASADLLKKAPALTVLVGAIVGALVTITSVGAGALGVTALSFLFPNLAARRIVGTDIAHAVPLTLVAGLGHWWLGDTPLDPQRKYLIRQTTRETKAAIEAIAYRLDINTLQKVAADRLGMNDIARVAFKLAGPLCVDAYADNRSIGAFIVIDETSNNTVGAGMIL